MCEKSGKIYPVAYLAPDIELKDMNQELFIHENDLEKQKMLGAGGFAAVFKARLDNVVKLFQFQNFKFHKNRNQAEK